MTSATLARRDLLAYSAFALPLAMAALPVYVHVPKFYADSLGLPLATVGAILLACRLLDALQDPFLGWLSDRTAGSRFGRGALILAALPWLAIGFVSLFNPLPSGAGALTLWLGVSLVVVYLGFSMGSIAYYALGAELSQDYHQRTRVTATRGAVAVAGVLIAAALPEWLAGRLGAQSGLALFSLLFVPVLAAGAWICIGAAPRSAVAAPRPAQPRRALRHALIEPLADTRYRWLIAVTVLSGIAAAIPGTLILFYVQDVLRRPDLSGLFLVLYFLFGALGMPLWIETARRLGKKRTWLIGMLLSVAAFVWAFALSEGDVLAFAAVCVLSGLAYGAELAIPPSMLADVVDARRGAAEDVRPDGAYFGVWQMIEKLNLALAAGLALLLLQWLGYVPGAPQAPHAALSWIYALVPCAIKLFAAACLWAAPLESRRPAPSVTPRPGVTAS